MTPPHAPSDDATVLDRTRASIRRLKQPAYTGVNRCGACTLVNVALVGVLTAVATLVWAPLGAVTGVFGVLAVYFRGYLVPGTPELTKRHVPVWLLVWAGKAGDTDQQPTTAPLSDSDREATPTWEPEAFLRDVGALTYSPAEEDLCLTHDVAREWRETIAEIRDGDRSTASALAAIVDARPADIAFSHAEDSSRVFAAVGDTFAGQWISNAALTADVAAAAVLAAWAPDSWRALNSRQKGLVLTAFRVFAPSCPTCDGPVTFHEDDTGGCCWSNPVVVLRCTTCEAPLIRLDQPTVDAVGEASSS
jgi:hypothetical protein